MKSICDNGIYILHLCNSTSLHLGTNLIYRMLKLVTHENGKSTQYEKKIEMKYIQRCRCLVYNAWCWIDIKNTRIYMCIQIHTNESKRNWTYILMALQRLQHNRLSRTPNYLGINHVSFTSSSAAAAGWCCFVVVISFSLVFRSAEYHAVYIC